MNKCTNIGWSIGNYCNAKCNHCYSWKTRKKSSEVLTHEEIDIIIEKLINYGVKTVNFGGNEPIFTNGQDITKTMLPYIIKRLYDENVFSGITTNGFTMMHLYENYRKEYMMVNDWDFSLDAPCKAEHDGNRNKSGLFDMVIRAIELCKRNNKPCSIVIAGMQSNLNKESLHAFLLLSKKYDTELRINLLKPVEKEHFKLLPSMEQVYEAFQYFTENTDFISLNEPVIAAQMGIPSTGCPCGIHSFRIRSKIDGRVPITPCVYLDIDAGDILTSSIDAIVNSEIFKNFTKRALLLPSKCREINCDILEQCRGGCSARTLLVTNDINEPDPYCVFLKQIQRIPLPKPIFVHKDEHDHVRVHENYLCTWIGKPKKEFV